ncbi:MAG: DUF309 domain-containing protein [Thermoanaerobaculia bacterium]
MKSSASDLDAAAARREGIRLFNEGLFWEAHEAWEAIWLVAAPPEKQFVQGLIQVAAAWHHVGRRNRIGATRLATRALARLEPFEQDYWRLDRTVAVEATRRLSSALEAEGGGQQLETLPRPRLREL